MLWFIRRFIIPEQISKYPEVTLKVLNGSGALCGEGAQQSILTKCPADRFCSLRAGEICVYGIDEIPQMTQITPQEIAGVVCHDYKQSSIFPTSLSGSELIVMVVLFLLGAIIGLFWRKFKIGSLWLMWMWMSMYTKFKMNYIEHIKRVQSYTQLNCTVSYFLLDSYSAILHRPSYQ